MDAWYILPWLRDLDRDSNLQLYAASGRLSMERKRVKRTLLWATIEGGELKQYLGSAALARLSQLPVPAITVSAK